MMKLLEELLGRPLRSPGDEAAGGAQADPEPKDADVSDDDSSAPSDDDVSDDDEPSDDDVDADADDADIDGRAKADDDDEEFDLNGEKLKIKRAVLAKLKPHIMMQADYQRNIQQVAEQRKSLERAQEEHATLSKERIQTQGQMAYAEEMIAAYDALDWARLNAEDFQLAQTRLIEKEQWKNRRESLSRKITDMDAKVSEARKTREAEMQGETLKQVGQAREALHRDIPNWDKIGPKVYDFAVAQGLNSAILDSLTDPTIGRVLYLAYLGQELSQKQKAAVQKRNAAGVKETTIPLEIVAKSGGGQAPMKKSLEKLAASDDMNAFAKTYEKTYGSNRRRH